MKFTHFLQGLWLCLVCPKFWEHYPKDDKDPGPWMAVAISFSFFRRREVLVEEVKGDMRDAYMRARWLAWELDCNTHFSLGIKWAVRRPEKYVATNNKNL